MTTRHTAGRRTVAVLAAVATVATGALSACSKEEKPTPPTSTSTTTSPSATPTEKGLDPTGGNKFTPTVKAPTPATAIPGDN
ncbi:hypothetical protein [Mycolicibacterium komossense]|uniref:Lipoprotein n=1 Tax=Mycolicibacterium komossense TaxID=1779 RepID=A0ABT3CM22_9MYCO|nr:hypothetical protein [Mycolicibacterium komossense]MCV7230467.1 hypothetical protein [Mycolicibacterium komossense]